MVIVKTVQDFKKYNEEQLKKFMRYKTGIFDENEIDDVVQDFYVKLIETKALNKFDKSEVKYGSAESVFNSYILNLFCWLLSYTKKKKDRIKIDSISTVTQKDKIFNKEIDIWEYVATKDDYTEYSIDSNFYHSSYLYDKEQQIESELDDFIEYIKKTETEKKASKMVHYIKHRSYGLKSVDIAKMLNVSNNMVKFIKNDTYSCYLRYKNSWKKPVYMKSW